jgi:hypothetical protein
MESKRGEPRSVIMVRLPKWLHETLKILAKDAEVSLNEYCVSQLNPERIEKLWKLMYEVNRLAAENERLKARLLAAAGDDLCRLSQEEIKAFTSGEVPIPPKEEFIPSCERFWEQTAARAGVNHNCLTLAQLVAENERLNAALLTNQPSSS